MIFFFKKCLEFFIFLILFILVSSSVYYYSGLYKNFVVSKSIYKVIDKSKTKHSAKLLLIGDSVAEQLFDPNNKESHEINSLACSYSVSSLGVYILLNNYLKANNNISDVVYLMGPNSFQNNLDLPWTYNYFLKPFFKTDNYVYFDDYSKDLIKNMEFSEFSQTIPFLITNWSPDYQYPKLNNNHFLSNISIFYLRKIKNLLKLNNIKFHIISPPISEYKNSQLNNLVKNIPTDLSIFFEDYFDNIEVLDDSLFLDNVHFIQPNIFKNPFEIKLNLILNKTKQ